MTAARMIVDRILPAPKGRHVSVELPEMKSAADLRGTRNNPGRRAEYREFRALLRELNKV